MKEKREKIKNKDTIRSSKEEFKPENDYAVLSYKNLVPH